MKFQLHKKRNFQHLDLWISRHYQLISPNEFHSPTPTLVGEGFLSNLSFRSEQTVRKRYSWSDNKKTGSVACPPSHLSSSSVAAPSGQLLAAILSKIMFLVKQPSVVYRVLNSDLCPPHACLLNSRKLLFLVAIMHKLPSWIVFSVFTSVSDYVCCLWWFGAVCTSGWYCHDFCAFTFWIRYVFSLQHLQAFSGCFYSHCCIMSCFAHGWGSSLVQLSVR